MATTVSEAQARVRAIFRDRMEVEVPSADTDLFESGLVDSLTFVELLVHLEEEFGRRVSLDELELEDLRSIDRIARVMSRNGSGPAP
jgi:acyl carrier protein